MALGAVTKLPGDGVTNPPYAKLPASGYEGTFDSTVFLWDAEYQPMAAVPDNATTFNNLLRSKAAEVSGLATSECDFSVVSTLSAGFAAGEITEKGGLHIAATQAGAQNAPSALVISPSAAWANWLLANIGAGENYAYLITAFLRTTRASLGLQSIMHFMGTTTATYGHISQNGGVSTLVGAAAGSNVAAPTVGNSGLMAVANSGWAGAKPANLASSFQRALLSIGATGPWVTGSYNKGSSHACYRLQMDIIDLSEIAGATRTIKSNAMVSQLEAMATRDFATGGRFANDTFTPAATLKP